jgi:hypothetical protein
MENIPIYKKKVWAYGRDYSEGTEILYGYLKMLGG